MSASGCSSLAHTGPPTVPALMLQFFQVLVGVMAQPEVAYPWSDTCRWILWLAWSAMTPKLQLFPVPGSGGHCCLVQPKPSMSVGALVWLRHAPQFPHSKAPISVPFLHVSALVWFKKTPEIAPSLSYMFLVAPTPIHPQIAFPGQSAALTPTLHSGDWDWVSTNLALSGPKMPASYW